MAQSVMSFQTEATVNVSQSYVSSPLVPMNELDKVNNDTNTVRVEYSIKDIQNLYKGGAVQPLRSQSMHDDEDDELYALSPQGKASQAKRIAASQRLEEASAFIKRTGTRDSAPIVPETNKGNGLSTKPHDAADALLAREVKVPDSVQKWRPRPFMNGSGKAVHEEPDELRNGDDGSIGSQPKSSGKPATHILIKKTGPVQTPVARNVNASSTMSALAALQRKKQARGGGATPIPLPSTSRITKASTSNMAASRDHSKDMQISARSSEVDVRATPAPTTGKLPSRKNRMLAQTPAPIVARAEHSKARTGASRSKQPQKPKANLAHRAAGDTVHEPTTARGSLKRPERAQPQRTAKRDAAYDISESSSPDRAIKSKGKGNQHKATPARKQASSAVKLASARRRGLQSSPKPISETDAGSRRAQAGEGDSPDEPRDGRESEKTLSVRTKTRKDSMAKPREAASPRRPEKPDALVDGNGPNEENRVAKNNEQAKETLGEFEATVIQYDKENGTDAIRARTLDLEAIGNAKGGELKGLKSRVVSFNDNTKTADGIQTTVGKKGASQDDAIVLSDRPQTSSPAESMLAQQEARQFTAPSVERSNETRAIVRFPKTSGVFQSSPPTAKLGNRTLALSAGGLVDTNMAKKSTIVAFGKPGPQNQGSLSVKKRVPNSNDMNRPPDPLTAAALASSTNSKTRLQAKRRQGPSSVATSMKTTRTNRTVPPSNVAENVTEAFAAFKKKARPKQDVMAAHQPSPFSAVPQGRATEMTIPPPIGDTDFMNIDDFDGPTLINAEQVQDATGQASGAGNLIDSQAAMPPPAPKASKKQKMHRAPTVPIMLGSEDVVSRKGSDSHTAGPQGEKRTLQADATALPAPKRQRMDIVTKSQDGEPQQKPPLSRSIVSMQDNSLLSQKETSRLLDPVKRVSRKPNRHISQGSQKVDIHGSPVPQGMVIPETATVLETYSRQAGISSDTVPADAVITLKSHEKDVESITARTQRLPLSNQPHVLSSNVKSRPAAPQEMSQAITSIVRVDPTRPLVEDETSLPSTDPFTSSDENRKQPRQGSSSSNFLEQLKRQTQHAPKTTSTFPRQDDDPDKTLVEPERLTRRPKRVDTYSTVSSSQSSAQTDDDSSLMRDIGTWRDGLQPHQMNLFNELVIIQHRIIRNLVDKDDAATDIVDDYRRRGQNLVEQMELSHAKEHRQYIEALKERKNRLRKDLGICGRKLKESMSTVVDVQLKRSKETSEATATLEKLEDIMAQFC